jgi:hypothetical protein
MKRSLLLFPFLLLCISAMAEDKPVANEAMGLLGLPRNSVRSGMAGAGSASVTAPAAFAALESPSVLPFATNKVEAALSYGRWSPSTAGSLSDNIGIAVAGKPFRALALSLAVVNQVHPVMDFGDGKGPFNPIDGIASLGAGVSFGRHFSLGASVIYVQQRLMADYKLSAFAFNAMAQYHSEHFDAAAGVINVGSKVKSENGTEYPLPSSGRLSGVYHSAFGHHGIEAALDADIYFSGKFGAALGLQYSYDNLIYARAGYRYAMQGAALPAHLALGLGVKWKGFRLDGSFLTANPTIGNSFLISIGYCY